MNVYILSKGYLYEGEIIISAHTTITQAARIVEQRIIDTPYTIEMYQFPKLVVRYIVTPNESNCLPYIYSITKCPITEDNDENKDSRS